MDYLWTPWRYSYLRQVDKKEGCIFCQKLAQADDEKSLIVLRSKYCFAILNAFPYTSGHLMIVPFEHVDQLQNLPAEAAAEMMQLAQRFEGVLRNVYKPDGLNVGMNIGKAGGAGVAGHIHMHVLPRWIADSNFMTTIGETRVLPEDLTTTWQRITEALR